MTCTALCTISSENFKKKGMRAIQVEVIGLKKIVQALLEMLKGRRGGLMVSALDSGVSVRVRALAGDCIVFLGKTLYSHGASLHPGV